MKKRVRENRTDLAGKKAALKGRETNRNEGRSRDRRTEREMER